MNNEVEQAIKAAFLEWRTAMLETERLFDKGVITYAEHINRQRDAIVKAGEWMFTAVHQHSDW